jgi:hypothetical protein
MKEKMKENRFDEEFILRKTACNNDTLTPLNLRRKFKKGGGTQ